MYTPKLSILFLVLTLSGCALTAKHEEKKAPCNGFKKTAIGGDCERHPINAPKWA